ncbi:Alpha/beta hydrolase family [Teratosphaeria destructans]|uniref:Alpha/beta hydrolase family n=1 Tax=Teratosphaeria destructans TaxID=418781 RepID=A0A9W7W249_9PEZI|nr:Alpha/beta hydrolase family [Teratosphaeria destructans]
MRPTALLPLASATAALNTSAYPSFTSAFGQVGTSDLSLQPNPLSTRNFQQPSAGSSRGGLAQCVSGYVNVPASTTQNVKLNFQIPVNQSQVTETFVDMVSSGSPFMQEIMGGMQSAGGDWTLGATLCVPRNDSAPKGVQLLTHGVGFDRYYWDFAPGYSYVDVAAAHGYASFFYDRLAVGVSQKADPIQTVQAPLEVAIAQTLASQLRAGTYGNCAFGTVVGVGHSFGSIITQAADRRRPVRADGRHPDRLLRQLDRPPRLHRSVTFGESSRPPRPPSPAVNFTGPVAVVDGAEDLPFCAGNCSYPVDKAAAVKPMLYAGLPAAKFASYLRP